MLYIQPLSSYLLNFMLSSRNGSKQQKFSIPREEEFRKAALALEDAGLIKVVFDGVECWEVMLSE